MTKQGRYLTDAGGNIIVCATCRHPAVRTIPGADGEPEPVCFTEDEGLRAVEQYFELAGRVHPRDRGDTDSR